MVTFNINDWTVCQLSKGSIVTKKRGPINCQNMKNVATARSGEAPGKLRWCPRGVCLNNFLIFFCLTEEQIFTGQFMILVGTENKIARVESVTLVNKSIFVKNQTLTFINLLYITHDIL